MDTRGEERPPFQRRKTQEHIPVNEFILMAEDVTARSGVVRMTFVPSKRKDFPTPPQEQ